MLEKPFELGTTVKGKGPTVVLLHGFLESNAMWHYLDLQTHFTTVAIDLPGHGLSQKTPTVTSIQLMAECVKKTLDAMHIDEFHLVGHSMGGYVALEFVKSFGLSGKLILLNSNFWQDDEQKKADRLRVANLALKNKKLFIKSAIPGLFTDNANHQNEIEAIIAEAFEISADHIASCSVAMRNRRFHLNTLKSVGKKVVILQGEFDKICPPEKMEKEIVGLEINYLKIPNAGHMSHIENTSFVRNRIIEILSNEN